MYRVRSSTTLWLPYCSIRSCCKITAIFDLFEQLLLRTAVYSLTITTIFVTRTSANVSERQWQRRTSEPRQRHQWHATSATSATWLSYAPRHAPCSWQNPVALSASIVPPRRVTVVHRTVHPADIRECKINLGQHSTASSQFDARWQSLCLQLKVVQKAVEIL